MATITVNNTTLSYTDQGKGTPVVLLHGFPLDRRIWDSVVPELAQNARVITLDLRGFGRSEPTSAFTIDTLADDVYLFIQALEVEGCVLGGLSMGGYVVQAFVKRYAELLHGFILLDTKSENDNPQQKDGRNKMIELARSIGTKAVAAEMLPKMLSGDASAHRPGVKDALQSIMESQPADTVQHALAALRDREDFRPLLPGYKLPALLIFGDHDQISPISLGEQMKSLLPSATLASIKGAGHLSPMEQPQQVAQAITQFISSIKRA